MKRSLPVFYSGLRNTTNIETGEVSVSDGISHFGFAGFQMVRPRNFTLNLGDERPIYEVQFRGMVYRMLCRPVDSSQGKRNELIRCCAPGMRKDGILMKEPEAIPNTPSALLSELMAVTGATKKELADEAYDLLQYREMHRSYPETDAPEEYSLRKRLLLVEEDGRTYSLYEKSRGGVNAEKWTLFLYGLDSEIAQKLVDYLCMDVSLVELGPNLHRDAMMAATLRFGRLSPSSYVRYSGKLMNIIPNGMNLLANGRCVGRRR